jgi:hypothetical protein
VLHHDSKPSVATKIAITTVVGAVSFPLTNLLFSSLSGQLAMSVGIGGLILIVQFLVEFESRLSSVESSQRENLAAMRSTIDIGFANLNYATQLVVGVEQAGVRSESMTELVRQAAELGPDTPPLVSAFVQSEIIRMTRLLHEVAEHEVNYDGEDRDLMLSLTGAVVRSIDATSLSTVDAGEKGYDAGFWSSDLGFRYLGAQHTAMRRGVRVRRVFILGNADIADDGVFRDMCRWQSQLGVEIRILYPDSIPKDMKSYLWDFILFDDTVSYEVTPAAQFDMAAGPVILHTRIVMESDKVKQRVERYRALWAAAEPFED